jgi:hypothetical protein
VAASLLLVAMVVAFALMVLRFDGHHALPTYPSTGAAVAGPSASDPTVVPSPSPARSLVALPQATTNPATESNPVVAGAGTQAATPAAKPSARPSGTILPSPLATPTPVLPSPLATPSPPIPIP